MDLWWTAIRMTTCSFAEVVEEIYNTITTDPLHIAKIVSRTLNVPKTSVIKILCTYLRIFPYPFPAYPDVETLKRAFFLIR